MLHPSFSRFAVSSAEGTHAPRAQKSPREPQLILAQTCVSVIALFRFFRQFHVPRSTRFRSQSAIPRLNRAVSPRRLMLECFKFTLPFPVAPLLPYSRTVAVRMTPLLTITITSYPSPVRFQFSRFTVRCVVCSLILAHGP